VLVQVTKDPIGHKGARLTSQITLAGRYLVLVPSGAMTGISRKLPDTERNRLKKLLKEIVPEGQGVIVRTAAEGASEEELRRDVERLTKTWADIDKKVKKTSTTAPVLLKGEPELSTRVVRDVFNEDFRSMTVQGDEAWKTISDYVGSVAPDLVERLHHWTAAEDVFAAHRIDEQLAKGMDRKVYLPSGGSLVIDRTEAMTVIDVNTGKFTGSGGTLEETVTRNNLEAAEEIVRQLRLRDIGGIIVVDFIDMVLESNRDLVLRRLVECLGRDRTRHQVAEVTSLGLVQMTRKRVGQGLVEAFSTTCEHCHGRGYVLHDEPVESGQSTEDADETPRSGRGGRGRGRRSAQAAPAPAAVEPAGDPAQRAQVRATLAAIAAAAAHAHEEHHLDEEPRPELPIEESSPAVDVETVEDATSDVESVEDATSDVETPGDATSEEILEHEAAPAEAASEPDTREPETPPADSPLEPAEQADAS
jgi:ribonuclease E